MQRYRKLNLKKMAVLFLALMFAVLIGFVPCRVYADYSELSAVLDQTAQLQNLADDFLQEQKATSETGEKLPSSLFLTINYIRTLRYDSPEWDMILGFPSDEFAQYVQQHNPELSGLQTIRQVTVPQAGTTVDFIHLIAGIGAAIHKVPIVATWGGDAFQLAMAGRNTDFDASYHRLQPLFGNTDENITYWPQSDLMADLDAVNIGSTMQKEAALAETIRSYYDCFSYEEQAQQFIVGHLGGADTSDATGFARQISELLLRDEGMQLLLISQKQLAYNDVGELQIPQDMLVPLQASCTLLAEHLAQAVVGEDIHAEEIPTQESDSAEPIAPAVPQGSAAAQNDAMYWLYEHRELLLLGMIGCAALIVAILGYLFTRRKG